VTYLAEIVQLSHFGQKVRAKLLGVKRSDGLWIQSAQTIVELPYSRVWHEQQLILLELDKRGNVEVAVSANERLNKALQEWSLKAFQFDTRKGDLDEKHESLKYQSAKLLKREADLKRREELQTILEKQLQSLEEKVQEKLVAVEIQHAALTEAWKHVHYKEQQLNEG